MNQIAGKTQSFFEALQPEFVSYSQNVIDMAKLMCKVFTSEGIKITTEGTDSHIILVHTGEKSGKQVADTLEKEYNIVVNKNSIPNDPRGVWQTSGIRIGTAAMVTLKGADQEYFEGIAQRISRVIND